MQRQSKTICAFQTPRRKAKSLCSQSPALCIYMRPAKNSNKAEQMKNSIKGVHSPGGAKGVPSAPASLLAYQLPPPPPSYHMVWSQCKQEQHVKTMCSWSSHWKAKEHLTWMSAPPRKDRTLGKPRLERQGHNQRQKRGTKNKDLRATGQHWEDAQPHPSQAGPQATNRSAQAGKTSSHRGTPNGAIPTFWRFLPNFSVRFWKKLPVLVWSFCQILPQNSYVWLLE